MSGARSETDPADELEQPVPTRSGARTTHHRGRMSDAKRAILETLLPRHGLDALAPLDPDVLRRHFGRDTDRVLDIGAGNGSATVALATARPDLDIVAVELHRPGVATLLRHIDDDGLTNIAVIVADITTVLDELRPGTFSAVRVLFPDPWPKARHRKRRLVDNDFVTTVCDRLPVGGTLHLATDSDDYADQIRAALATDPRLDPVIDHDDGAVPADASIHLHINGTPPTRWRTRRPDRPVTVYEQRGLDAGRTITDLIAHRTR